MSISPKNEASQNNNAKRRDYISWDEYFMGIAMLSAMRSKDPNSQVGACIVRDNKILSLGTTVCRLAAMTISCLGAGKETNSKPSTCMSVTRS